MTQLPEKMKCKYCGDMAVLITDNCNAEPYYYHYSTDYNKGCHQRINPDTNRYASLISWNDSDEIKHLEQLVQQLRKQLKPSKELSVIRKRTADGMLRSENTTLKMCLHNSTSATARYKGALRHVFHTIEMMQKELIDVDTKELEVCKKKLRKHKKYVEAIIGVLGSLTDVTHKSKEITKRIDSYTQE